MATIATDKEAFSRFYEATSGAIRAYLLRHCRDRDSVDDLFQITYMKFLGSRMASSPQSPNARAYLYRIASNAIKDHGRAWHRRMQLSKESRHLQAQMADVPSLPDIALRDALATLPRRQQQLLWLLYVEGFSHKEVARIIKVRPASVRVLAFRARKRLSSRLAATQPSDGEAGK